MINKLLDEPYWTELPDLISQIMGEKPINIDVSHSVMKKWSWHNPARSILQGDLYETDQYLFLGYPLRSPTNKKRLYSASMVTKWLSRNLPEVKMLLINGIVLLFETCNLVEPEEIIKIRFELMKEKNLQKLFQAFHNAAESAQINEAITDLDYLKRPIDFEPIYPWIDINSSGDEIILRRKRD